MMNEEMTRLSIDVSKDLYKLIKYTATFEEQTIKDFVVGAIEEKLHNKLPQQQQELNELTKITLEKEDRGEELETYQSVDAFFESLKEDE